MPSIRSIMTETIRTICRDTYVREVAGIFEAEGSGGAPPVDEDGGTVGVISKTDISRFDFIGGDPYSARAWEICSPHPVIVEVTSSVEEAAQTMFEHRIHHLLVAERGEIVGILSSLDFVKLVANGDR